MRRVGERGDGLSAFGEVGSIWTARRDHCVVLFPIRSRWPSRRACQFVHRLLKFLNKVSDATTASPVAMAGMIKSSIHHFDGFVGLAGNSGGSGKRGGRTVV